MKHYAKTKYMFSGDNRILHKGTLEALESLKNIQVGTVVEIPSQVKGFDIKLLAIEVDEEKAIWMIE